MTGAEAKLTELISTYANVATALCAIIGLVLGILQIRGAWRAHQEATARGIFRDFSNLAFAHPEYADPKLLSFDPVDGPNTKERQQYEWFVSHMLTGCDEIIIAMPGDESWKKAIKLHFRTHRKYLSGSRFRSSGEMEIYSKELCDLINEIAPPRPQARVVEGLKEGKQARSVAREADGA